jgi:hypothetical protein
MSPRLVVAIVPRWCVVTTTGPWAIAAPEPEERARPLLLATGQNARQLDTRHAAREIRVLT